APSLAGGITVPVLAGACWSGSAKATLERARTNAVAEVASRSFRIKGSLEFQNQLDGLWNCSCPAGKAVGRPYPYVVTRRLEVQCLGAIYADRTFVYDCGWP